MLSCKKICPDKLQKYRKLLTTLYPPKTRTAIGRARQFGICASREVRLFEKLTNRAHMCKNLRGAQESIPSLAGRDDNPIWHTGPPSYVRLAEQIPWNRFLGSLNVYKFGLWVATQDFSVSYQCFRWETTLYRQSGSSLPCMILLPPSHLVYFFTDGSGNFLKSERLAYLCALGSSNS
jgi:hypothetical protein